MSDKLNEYELVLIHLLINEEVLSYARGVGLAPEHFEGKRAYEHIRILYHVILAFHIKYNSMPSEKMLKYEANNVMGGMPLLSTKIKDNVNKFITLAFTWTAEDQCVDYVLSRNGPLQRLVDELMVHSHIERANSVDTPEEDINGILEEAKKAYDVTRIARTQSVDLFDESTMERMLEDDPLLLTGVPFIDKLLGGVPPTALMGLLAESSGGKTMMGVQFVIEQALLKRNCIAYYYEQGIAGDIARRYYSYAGQIPRSEINLPLKELAPEVRKRISSLGKVIHPYLKVEDMSGSNGQGYGGAEEIEANVAQHIRMGYRPDFILVDWLGSMARRDSSSMSGKDESMKVKMDNVLEHLNSSVCKKYGCNMLVLHQLAQHAISGKNPHFVPEYTMASECKSFGVLMDYVFTLGRADKNSGCMWFCVSKARGAPKETRIVRMDAEYNIIRDAGDDWMIAKNPVNGEFFLEQRDTSFGGTSDDVWDEYE